MKYFLTKHSVLKWLETPSVYNIKKDELYELDNESFEFLKKFQNNPPRPPLAKGDGRLGRLAEERGIF